MNVLVLALAACSALCCLPIHSIGELRTPIKYVDGQQGYFIGIEKNTFVIGTAIDQVRSPANDMSQVSGSVRNCSSRAIKCRSIAYLVFAVPREQAEDAEYLDGPKITLARLQNGGWHGTATCSSLTNTGCSPHVDMGKPVVEYEYEIDPAGTLTSLKVRNWNGKGEMSSTQSLVLTSKVGLKLD
ncbi:hypothetical protein [Luteibacter aegosomatissinici]|uniref:hypothetical protein n=1 Tax=Luteibacter aegosomatissinici TaxID=2911539 RepID=UPI001FFB2AF6|nr:hypothetical protein [Luteibacter aegosomatissinici]UPG92644.1 hypothetical protein L2Y97_12275 [Luteibacter aegosomatissinici]